MNRHIWSQARNHVRPLLALLFACCVPLVTGCRIPPLRAPQPTNPLPDTFKGVTTPTSSAQMTPTEFFNDPKLTALIEQALVNNQDLKILAEDIQIANNEILFRRGAYLPFVSLRAGGGFDKSSKFTRDGAVDESLEILPGKRIPNPLPDFLLGAEVSWQVDIWRKFRNAQAAATLRYLGTADGRNFVVTRLVAEIAENYYALMALDRRLENLNDIIKAQELSQKQAQALKDQGKGTELGVQRFLAEVEKNQSEKLIIQQEIIERENRINFLAGRFPQPVERSSEDFISLNLPTVSVGVPSQLLLNRPDIRQAERELEAAGLEVQVARAEFYPSLDITAGIGYRVFNPKYLFDPGSLVATAAGDLVAPLFNRAAIKATYKTANARQLQALYNYQKVILEAFTEVINQVTAVENYRQSIEYKKKQLDALAASVDVATKLFQNARAEYIEVLFALRDQLEAKQVLIATKQLQLSAVVNAYQALGGGYVNPNPTPPATPPAVEPVPAIPPPNE